MAFATPLWGHFVPTWRRFLKPGHQSFTVDLATFAGRRSDVGTRRLQPERHGRRNVTATPTHATESVRLLAQNETPGEAPERSPIAKPSVAQRLGSFLRSNRQMVDFVLLFGAFLLVTLVAPIGTIRPVAVALLAAAVTTTAARQMGAYSAAAADLASVAWKRSIAALAISSGAFLLTMYVTNAGHDRAWLPLALVGALTVLSTHRILAVALGSKPTRLALLGDAKSIAEFDKLEHTEQRRQVVERTALETYDDIRPALRQVDQLIDLVDAGEIDRIVVLATAPGLPVVNAIVRRCSMRGVSVDLLTGATRVRPSRLDLGRMHGFSTVHIQPGLRGPGRLALKRVFDLVIASLAIVLLAPVMAVAAAAVKLTSPGPVFYKQRRLGRGGQQFEMIKFRSMVADADTLLLDLTEQNEADGPLFKIKEDPRITNVGRIIRRTSIDELPQLFNVLRGNMSLVGPRPALANEADGWPIELFDRLEVAPGITGLWQVTGRSDTSFADYQRLDLYYVDNWTIGLDFAILARTVPALLGRGAY